MGNEKEIIEELNDAIRKFDEERARKAAQKAVEAKIDLVKTIKEMSETLREVGERFHCGEIFIPHLVMAGDAMIGAVKIFELTIPKEDLEKTRLGIAVLGTVEGDEHDIGLNLVAMSLITVGFKVYNLGKNVETQRFIDKAMEVNADIIGASTLLSVTMYKQKDLVEEVKEKNLPFKVIVGGGPVTLQWAEEIGADGYGADATEAVDIAKKLIERQGSN